MIFKPHEIAYLQAADLGRLATIAPNGSPQASPVGFTYNGQLETIDISGYRMSQSQKFRNIATNNKVALVVDDIASRNPWRVRCLEIRGTAEQATQADGQSAPPTTGWIRRSSASPPAGSSASGSMTPKPSRTC
jgi:pyridoxamine 5'-phosphate oxidase family protein